MTSTLTEKQKTCLESYLRTGNKSETARELGVDEKSVRNCLIRIERKGLAPWLSPAPIPEHRTMGKTTVQYNASGVVVNEWRRLHATQQMAEEFVAGLCERVKGKARVPVRKDRKADSDKICFELCLYDLHFGLYASARETHDADYDTGIARDRLLMASEDLLGRACRPDTIRVILGGDQLRADDSRNRTPQSGHALDVDTRTALVARKLIAASREVISMAAEVAKHVEIYVVQGNHDPESSLWLAEVLRAYYSQCPNVSVCDQDTRRKVAIWGDCMSIYGHGDSIKPDRWAQIISAEYWREWGRTRWRYARLGHFHHKRVIAPVVVEEVSGLEVTYLTSPAAVDAWHSQSGYVGTNRGMQAFELHKDAGQISAFVCNVRKG